MNTRLLIIPVVLLTGVLLSACTMPWQAPRREGLMPVDTVLTSTESEAVPTEPMLSSEDELELLMMEADTLADDTESPVLDDLTLELE